jgi:hypothetical protein
MRIKHLIAELQEEDKEAAVLVQYYTVDHAAIPEAYFEAVAEYLQGNDNFLEDIHEVFTSWMTEALDIVQELEEEGNAN